MAFRIPDLFSSYLRHADINDYLDYLATKYPDTVSVETCGTSYEGRALKSIRITHNTGKDARMLSATVPKKSSKRSFTSKSSRSLKSSKTSKTNVAQNSSPSLKSTNTPVVVKSKLNISSKKLVTKPVVLIDGGIHAREWISVATAIYCIHQLTEEWARNAGVLSKLDFVIVPVVNADGYEYTHTHVSMHHYKTIMVFNI